MENHSYKYQKINILTFCYVYSFVTIESSAGEDIDDDDYIRDGTDYGNITRIHDETEGEPDIIIEPLDLGPTGDSGPSEETDLNATIVSGEDMEPTSSIWEGIMGLVEDIDRDSKLVDVSSFLNFICFFLLIQAHTVYAKEFF